MNFFIHKVIYSSPKFWYLWPLYVSNSWPPNAALNRVKKVAPGPEKAWVSGNREWNAIPNPRILIKKTTKKDTKSLLIAKIMMTNCPRCWKKERKRRREIDMGIAEMARRPLATLW
jgi:hypothetical protein